MDAYFVGFHEPNILENSNQDTVAYFIGFSYILGRMSLSMVISPVV